MISVEGMSLVFEGSKTPLFTDLSFAVGGGEVLAVLGRNGVGKTTLLKCILGLTTNYSGTVKSVERIGYVPQKIFPVFEMPSIEMIVMGRMPYLGMFGLPGTEDYGIAERIAADLGITELLGRSFNDLSGGQKQLILIARALCMEPSAVIFDEPMSALDYKNQDRVLSLLKTIAQQGMAVIFSTHDPTHAIHVADKTLLLKDEYVHHFGAADEIIVDDILGDVYGIQICVHDLRDNKVVNPIYG